MVTFGVLAANPDTHFCQIAIQCSQKPKLWNVETLSGRYIFCLIIALSSGAAALSHQLLWTRRLVDILGATGEATSLVLGCFFFGLSVGAAVASRFVDRISAPWKTLALVEFIIVLLTIPAAVLPHFTEWIWPALGPEALTSWPGKCVKLTISTLVVVPPAIAMGMTLPILIVAIEKTVTDNQSAKVLVYAFNTLGGALGLLLTSVVVAWSIGCPWQHDGRDGHKYANCAGSLVVAALYFWRSQVAAEEDAASCTKPV